MQRNLAPGAATAAMPAKDAPSREPISRMDFAPRTYSSIQLNCCSYCSMASSPHPASRKARLYCAGRYGFQNGSGSHSLTECRVASLSLLVLKLAANLDGLAQTGN